MSRECRTTFIIRELCAKSSHVSRNVRTNVARYSSNIRVVRILVACSPCMWTGHNTAPLHTTFVHTLWELRTNCARMVYDSIVARRSEKNLSECWTFPYFRHSHPSHIVRVPRENRPYCCSHTKANILANMKNWDSRQIHRKCYEWPGEILNKVRPYKYLRMLANFLRILLRMLRMLTNAITNVTNAYDYRCECLRTPYKWNGYKTQASWKVKTNDIYSKSLQMSCVYYKCLAINKNGLRSLQMPCLQ